ncbi:S1C family serine protease [Chloroflexota bacterium]
MKTATAKLSLLLLTLLLVLLSVGSCVYIQSPTESPSQPGPSTTPPTPAEPINPGWTPPLQEASTIILPSIADVVAAVKPSVVAINTEVVTMDFFNRPFTQQGAGSGWIIDNSGIIVTNNHVIEGAQAITVTLDDGRTFNTETQNIFTDALNDLAILKIDAQNLPAIKIGDSSMLRVGDWVVAIGNSLGLGISAKQGIISRLGVNIPVGQGETLYDLLETSAAINPGNSGGPLVNLAGELIGITSAKISAAGIEGMGYAISTEIAIPIIEALIKNGYVVRPWLGVGLHTVDEFTAMRYNLAVSQGVLITEVSRNSPAEKSGLEPGDVIINFAGKETTNVQELTRAIHAEKIGQTTQVTFWRENERLTTEIIPTETPPPP